MNISLSKSYVFHWMDYFKNCNEYIKINFYYRGHYRISILGDLSTTNINYYFNYRTNWWLKSILSYLRIKFCILMFKLKNCKNALKQGWPDWILGGWGYFENTPKTQNFTYIWRTECRGRLSETAFQ